ncbi:Ig-like domain-containing protein, partial [Escherichia coli]|nr:Ig-like domain-containing protein [Escherichia coli]
TVKAATVPELTISTASSSPSAGGVEIPLTFTFSEEVKEFSFSDVKLEASDKNEAGELQQVSWNTIDNITWTATYTTPEKQNKE